MSLSHGKLSLFKVKKTLTEMMIDRGYEVGDVEKSVLEMKDEDQFDKYTKNLLSGKIKSRWLKRLEGFGGDSKIKFPVNKRTILGNEYTKMRNGEKVKCLVVFVEENAKMISVNTIKMTEIELHDVLNRGKDYFNELIIITNLDLSDGSNTQIKELKYTNSWIFHDKELTFNKTKHVLVPKHERLSDEKASEFKRNYKGPQAHILITDPIVKYYGWRLGDVIMITRDLSFMASLSTEMVAKRVVVADNSVK